MSSPLPHIKTIQKPSNNPNNPMGLLLLLCATEMIVTIMRHKCFCVSLSVDIKNCIYANHLIKGRPALVLSLLLLLLFLYLW